MEFWQWTAQNWFNLLSVLGIVGSIWIAIASLQGTTKTQRITNLLAITTNHREIWKELSRNPSLHRVLDPNVDCVKEPIKPDEQMFVSTLISHMNAVFYATKGNLTIKLEGLQYDTAWFFSLPIPGAVWEKIKSFQNDDFAAFVESCRRLK